MIKTLSLLLLLLLLSAAGCRPSPAVDFARATPSTPVADLPMALGAATPTVYFPTAVPPAVIAEADAEYLLLANIYDRSAASVVSVEARMPVTSGYPQGELVRGSGFVYDIKGHIVTNAHVINGASEVRVTFHEGDTSAASIVGVDTYSDLGVIQVPSDGLRLRPLTMGSSDTVRVGQRAITIGNPFGLAASMSVGIISGVGRTLRSGELIDAQALPGYQNPSIIQMDAAINPGSSGGPLLNSQGLVMGVTTAIRTDSGVFAGVGFAVPGNTVQRVVPRLIAAGRVDYPWLGVSVSPEENGYSVAGLADVLNLPVTSGVLVRGIALGSPAETAGLRGGAQVIDVRGQPVCVGGDIIVAINDEPVASMDALTAYLIEHTSVGDTVTLRVVRDRQSFDVPLRLSARPSSAGTVRDCVR